MNRLNSFGSTGGVKLYPAEFKYQIKQARVVAAAVMYLLSLFNMNTPKAPRNRAGLHDEMLGNASRRAV
ncbi:MAG: hypothetical protein B7Z77_06670 [Acidocella sp. 20-58-15]|nr:MAG: hypothetical protein B7Z77_06670 [Acidocella sp. 20-58-15]